MNATNYFKRLATYASFVKLEHTVFSLPLIFSGAVLADMRMPSLGVSFLILLGGAGARVFAMGVNRIIDSGIDSQNPRTKARELPSKAMNAWEARIVIGVGCIFYFVSAYLLGKVCLMLSPIPLVLFSAYPYLKRFTSLSHIGLGIAWSMAPVGGWLAVRNSLDGLNSVGLLWLFSLFWLSGFDIIYATLDEQFDRKAGVHSLPAKVGSDKALKIAALLHMWAFLALYTLWKNQIGRSGAFAWLVAIGVCFILQHALAKRKPELAFFHINAVVGLLVLAFVLAGT
jgi:4-hydroxybenzoate polyprenyltransferase